MKNKEIDELLKNFQEVLDNPTITDECYDGRIIEIDRSYDLEQDEIKLLLSYIEQLEKRNKELYEGFMATQEELTDYATKNEQLENNRDKAIKILGNYKHYYTPTEEQNRENEEIVDNAYNILKGDSDEK